MSLKYEPVQAFLEARHTVSDNVVEELCRGVTWKLLVSFSDKCRDVIAGAAAGEPGAIKQGLEVRLVSSPSLACSGRVCELINLPFSPGAPNVLESVPCGDQRRRDVRGPL